MNKKIEFQNCTIAIDNEIYYALPKELVNFVKEQDKEIERLKGKLERIDCLIHKAINEREINGVGNLNLHEILELLGSDDNE